MSRSSPNVAPIRRQREDASVDRGAPTGAREVLRNAQSVTNVSIRIGKGVLVPVARNRARWGSAGVSRVRDRPPPSPLSAVKAAHFHASYRRS